jgi:hypothetical protein
MPLKQLVEDDAVHEATETDPEQDAGEPRASNRLVPYIGSRAVAGCSGLMLSSHGHSRAPLVGIRCDLDDAHAARGQNPRGRHFLSGRQSA